MPQYSDPYPVITFLGTGGSGVKLYRGYSAILVYINETTSILLDCGEGTLGQMIRHFGKDKYRDELKKIKAIFISHIHADHQLGLFSLLKERQNIDKNSSLYLCIPDNFNVIIHPLINLFAKNDILNNVQILSTKWFNDDIQNELIAYAENQKKHIETNAIFQIYQTTSKIENTIQQNKQIVKMVKKFINELGLQDFIAIPVVHIAFSYGVLIKFKNGFSFVYSSDCRPTKTLIDVGKNCDLLIHECTHYDVKKAKFDFHSTVEEAIDVFESMNAKDLILNHFGKAITDNTKVLFHKIRNYKNVGVSFDHMVINRHNYKRVKSYNRIIEDLF